MEQERKKGWETEKRERETRTGRKTKGWKREKNRDGPQDRDGGIQK